ncbi:MAG: radical SAM protein, partial [Candidatus Omnitrophota bacterium]
PEEILSELKAFLAGLDLKTQPINYITISGSGEPTLNSRLGEIIREIKRLTNIPVCVITNSSLLYDPKVREEIAAADLIMPTLNGVTPQVFERVCRGHADLNLKNIIQGLIALRKEYRGKIFLEIMLVKGINDRIAEIRKMKDVVEEINPDKIFLTLPERVTSEKWVRPPGLKTLQKIKGILGEKCEIV